MTTLNYYQTAKQSVVVNGEVEELTLQDFLNEFITDETTTPHGVAERYHIRYNYSFVTGVDEDENDIVSEDTYLTEQDIVDMEGNVVAPTFQIWSWGAGGNHPSKVNSYDTEEDALVDLLERKESHWNNDSRDYRFEFAGTTEECNEYLSEKE